MKRVVKSKLLRSVRAIVWLALALNLLASAGTVPLERHSHGPFDVSPDCAACLAVGTAPDSPTVPITLGETPRDVSTEVPAIPEESCRAATLPSVPRLRAPPASSL